MACIEDGLSETEIENETSKAPFFKTLIRTVGRIYKSLGGSIPMISLLIYIIVDLAKHRPSFFNQRGYVNTVMIISVLNIFHWVYIVSVCQIIFPYSVPHTDLSSARSCATASIGLIIMGIGIAINWIDIYFGSHLYILWSIGTALIVISLFHSLVIAARSWIVAPILFEDNLSDEPLSKNKIALLNTIINLVLMIIPLLEFIPIVYLVMDLLELGRHWDVGDYFDYVILAMMPTILVGVCLMYICFTPFTTMLFSFKESWFKCILCLWCGIIVMTIGFTLKYVEIRIHGTHYGLKVFIIVLVFVSFIHSVVISTRIRVAFNDILNRCV